MAPHAKEPGKAGPALSTSCGGPAPITSSLYPPTLGPSQAAPEAGCVLATRLPAGPEATSLPTFPSAINPQGQHLSKRPLPGPPLRKGASQLPAPTPELSSHTPTPGLPPAGKPPTVPAWACLLGLRIPTSILLCLPLRSPPQGHWKLPSFYYLQAQQAPALPQVQPHSPRVSWKCHPNHSAAPWVEVEGVGCFCYPEWLLSTSFSSSGRTSDSTPILRRVSGSGLSLGPPPSPSASLRGIGQRLLARILQGHLNPRPGFRGQRPQSASLAFQVKVRDPRREGG